MNKFIRKNSHLLKLEGLLKINTKNSLNGGLNFFNYTTENKEGLKKPNLNQFRQNFRKNNFQQNKFENTSKIDTYSKRSFENKSDLSFSNDESNFDIPKIPMLKPTINKYENKLKGNNLNFDEESELVPQQDLIPNIRAKGYFERDRLDTTTP
jgi:hypothetical protein